MTGSQMWAIAGIIGLFALALGLGLNYRGTQNRSSIQPWQLTPARERSMATWGMLLAFGGILVYLAAITVGQ